MRFPSAIWPFKSKDTSEFVGTCVLVCASASTGRKLNISSMTCSAETTVDWGDGNTTVLQSGASENVNHSYQADGLYPIVISNTVTSMVVSGTQNGSIPLPTGDYASFFVITWPPLLTLLSSPMIVNVMRVGSNLTSFGDYAFADSTNMADRPFMPLRSGMTLGKYCFKNCTSLKEISQSSVPIILSEGCFENCTSLVGFSGLEIVGNIPDRCFYGCRSLLPDRVPMSTWGNGSGSHLVSFGDYAFAGCSSFTNLDIMDLGDVNRISSIGEGCFSGCANLSNLSKFSYCFQRVRTIPKRCFMNDVKITSLAGLTNNYIHIPGDNNSQGYPIWRRPNYVAFGDEAFYGCVDITSFAYYVEEYGTYLRTIGARNFKGSKFSTFSGSPQGITSFGDECFMGCTKLSSLSGISPALTSLGYSCFEGCYERTYDSDGQVVSTTGLATLLDPQQFSIADITVGKACFRNCKALQSAASFVRAIALSVPESCFEGCSLLHEIAPGSTGPSRILARSFAGCAEIYESNDKKVFSGLVDLSGDSWPNYPVGTEAFKDCTFLVSTPVFGPNCHSFGTGCFENCRNLRDVLFSPVTQYASLPKFGDRCFANCYWDDNDPEDNPIKKVSAGDQDYACAYQSQVIPAVSRLGGLTGPSGIIGRMKGLVLYGIKSHSLQNWDRIVTYLSLVLRDAKRMSASASGYHFANLTATIDNILSSYSSVSTVSCNLARSYLDGYVNDMCTGTYPAGQKDNLLYSGTFVSMVFSSSPVTSYNAFVSGITVYGKTTSLIPNNGWNVDFSPYLFTFRWGNNAINHLSHLTDVSDLVITGPGQSIVVGSFTDTRSYIGDCDISFDVIGMQEGSVEDSAGNTRQVLTSLSIDVYVCGSDNGGPFRDRVMSFTCGPFERLEPGWTMDDLASKTITTLITCITSSESVSGLIQTGDSYATVGEVLSAVNSYVSGHPDLLRTLQADSRFLAPFQFPFGKQCFSGCGKFQWPDEADFVFDRVSQECFSGTAITDMKTVKFISLGSGSFSGSSITALIPGLGSVPPKSFSGCEDLSDVTALSGSVRSVGERAFDGCSSLANVMAVPDDSTDSYLQSNGLDETYAACRMWSSHPSRVLAGTAVTSMGFARNNSLRDPMYDPVPDPDPNGSGEDVAYKFAADLFQSGLFTISVDVVKPYYRTPRYDRYQEPVHEPVIKIRSQTGSSFIALRAKFEWSGPNTTPVDTAGDYYYIGGTREAVKFDGTTERYVFNATFEQVSGNVDNWIIDPDDHSHPYSELRHNKAVTYVGNGQKTGWSHVANSAGEYLILKIVSITQSGKNSVITFTCGPYQFSAIINIKYDPSAHVHRESIYYLTGLQSSFEVVGIQILSASVRSGYGTTPVYRQILPKATAMSTGAYADCTSLSDLWWFPSFRSQIPRDTFRGCTSLAGLDDLPDTVTGFGQRAFAGCPFSQKTPIVPSQSATVSITYTSCPDEYKPKFQQAFNSITPSMVSASRTLTFSGTNIVREGSPVQWVQVSYDSDTGKWNDPSVYPIGNMSTVPGESLGISLYSKSVDDNSVTLTFVFWRLGRTTYDGQAVVVCRYPDVIVRNHSVDVPNRITYVGPDCFSFREYPDAENVLDCVKFVGRSSLQITGMENFPWGVPDGCRIIDTDDNVVYYKEPEDD